MYRPTLKFFSTLTLEHLKAVDTNRLTNYKLKYDYRSNVDLLGKLCYPDSPYAPLGCSAQQLPPNVVESHIIIAFKDLHNYGL